MSGAPKRLHEEGSHTTPAKRPLDDSSLYSSPGKVIQSSGSDFHSSFEHDGRFAKIQRVEPRDDKRPSLTHRMPVSSTNFADHPISSDSRLESKQIKDARDTKADDRETKADARDVYSDSRIEIQANKIQGDAKVDNRADESEIKADRRGHPDYKGDIKFDKDCHSTVPANIAWKDNTEHRGKRYFEQPADNVDGRLTLPRPSLQGTDETLKFPISVEERNSKDAHESAGDNKAEPRSEDKFRDKDRKKKDEKHRDFGAREGDRNDRRTGVQLSGSGVERREMQREDRDADKWDRERKDSLRDKEDNDRGKDSARKDSSVVIEKDNTILEKASSDGAVKSAEHGNTATESKAPKHDLWNAHDRDPKDKKREKDVDAGDRHEQRRIYNDKESDDNGTEGGMEKDKEVSGSFARKRVVRPRGGSQASQREPRFRSRMRDGEGSLGKSEVSAIVYKAGECMQELLKSWTEFNATQDATNAESLQNGPTLEIRIPAEFVTSTNRQIDNESSCSSPADGTLRSSADDTRTSPDKESPCSHSSTCRRSSSILCRLDSGQQPHPRNMDDSKDAELLRILAYARVHQKQINSRWYQEDAVLERILKTTTINSKFPGIDLAMLKQRIMEFEKMVIDYHEDKLTTMPNQDLMLHVFSNIMHDYEQIPETPLNSGKRATLVSEELEAPSTKRARSESVDMVMYMSNPDAASKLLKGGLGMDDCTTRAEYLLHDSHMLYPAITLLRQNIEIRQSFMTFGDSHARGYIEYELKQHGML